MDIQRFVKERNEALFSLDREKITAFCEKWDVPFSKNEYVFWTGVHKTILRITTSTEEQKKSSKKWLEEHPFSSDAEKL